METSEQLKQHLINEMKKLIERRDNGENLQYIIDKCMHAVSSYEDKSLVKLILDKVRDQSSN